MNDEHNPNDPRPETEQPPTTEGGGEEAAAQTTVQTADPATDPATAPAETPGETPAETTAPAPAEETTATPAQQPTETPPGDVGDNVGDSSLPDQPAIAPAAPQPPPREELPPIITVVGVKFRRAGKTYFFICGTLRFSIGEQVIVETDRGLGLARVVTPAFEMESKKAGKDIKRVIRKANWNDLERDRKNKEREEEAAKLCLSKINERRLAMKLVWVEYYHDASKAVFYFTAEQRVDFRDLVKDLARLLHTRIEMRQIGVRDEAKMCGGLGPCGRTACCNTFLTDFSPVSVRMAKDQNLAMNPAKVSGLCGRLMCCLAYEHELYVENLKGMPKKGKRMSSNQGLCRVIDLNILTRQVLCELESGKTVFIPANELGPPDQARSAGVREEPEEETLAGVNEDVLDSDDPALLERALNKSPAPAPAKSGRSGGRDQTPRRRSEQSPPGRPVPPGASAPAGAPSGGRDQRHRDRPRRGDRDRPRQERDQGGPGKTPPPGSRPYNKGNGPQAPAGSRPYRPEGKDAPRPDQAANQPRPGPGPAPGNPPPDGARPPGRRQRRKKRRT